MAKSASNISSSLKAVSSDSKHLSSGSAHVSGSVSSYVSDIGAGGHSAIVVQSSTGEYSISENSAFVPGATSASSSATAEVSDKGATTSASVSVPAGEQSHSSEPSSSSSESEEEPAIGETVSNVNETSQTLPVVAISLLLGTPHDNLLTSTAQQDIFWGGAADIFQLSSTGVAELNQADIILDYSPAAGDHLAISEALTAEALIFDVVDFSGDGTADSTVVRSSTDNTILAVVLNTVNELGETLLSTADFLDPAAIEAWVASNSSPEPGTSGSSQTSSSSSAFVDGSGAGNSSSATATSPTGETSTSSEIVYTPGASSRCASLNTPIGIYLMLLRLFI
ncbi:MAG: hypothetical protein ACR2FS_16575 [Phormidesmis sp.]